MSSDKKIITVKSDDFNTQTVYLASMAVKNGEKVSKEQIVAVVETSKKVMEVVSPFDGFLYFNVEEGEQFDISEPLAFVSANQLNNWKKETPALKSESGFTLKARSLARRFGLSETDFNSKKQIKEEDVLDLLKTKNISVQAFEAQLFLAEESLQTNLYTSSVSVLFNFEKLQKRLKRESENLNKAVNADALFAVAVHQVLKKYERLTSYIENSELVYLGDCPVGVYISDEHKKGATYVLTANEMATINAAADRCYEIYRNFLNNDVEAKAQRAAFYISNMMTMEIQALSPMLKKGSVATMGIASPDKHGAYLVTLAFDHRLLDGGYAARFLNEVKIFIEIIKE